MKPETARFILVSVLLLAILAAAYRPKLLPLIAIGGFFVIYATGLEERVQVWNVFHYWLNTKYVNELGYNDLYSCAYEVGGARYFGEGEVRNLYTYGYDKPADLPPCPIENFTPERWQAFSEDMAWLRTMPGRWHYLMRDKGLNTTPTWISLIGRLANAFPAGSRGWWLVLNADFILLASSLVFVGFVRGPKIASLMTIFLLTWIGTASQLTGHWFQYLWLALCLFSLGAWHKKWFLLSGMALATAAALRIFPAVLFIWPVLHWRKMSKRFWAGAGGAGIVAFVVGSATPSGLSIWPEFISKMMRHSSHIVMEPGNLGLRNVIAMATNPAQALAVWEAFARGNVDGVVFQQPPTWSWGAVAIMVLLTIISTKKQKKMAFSSGLPLMFGALVVSRYYYGIVALVFDEIGDNETVLLLLICLVSLISVYWLHPAIGYSVGQFLMLCYLYWRLNKWI